MFIEMKNWIINKFVKDHENVKDPAVRERYGSVAGAVGIISNLILCIFKILTGIFFGSISILADGINNLSDASASLITLLGFKLSAKKPDKDHPYGHGRTEYLTGLAISIMILIIGFELFKTSLEKTIHPEEIELSYLTVIVLVCAIAIKIWQAGFNKSIGKLIDSEALIATAADSRNDVISTSAVLAATLVSGFTSLNLDGPMGIVVALFILWSGIGLVKDTISPILGQPPDAETVQSISDLILAHDSVLGIHDLIVHDYGPGRLFASVHAEVDGSKDVFEIHDDIDNIEVEVYEKMGVLLTIHMDPVDVGNPEVELAKDRIRSVTSNIDGIMSYHDVRLVTGPTHTNVVFDIVKDHSCPYDDKTLRKMIQDGMRGFDPKYNAVITIDSSFV